ncbi:MAG: efflux RND transporter periplasmic adaptor subunit [Helicobacter sp.]|nr:efflux RND transporter periplasmic adaptor subunit [Helicobacter sp.]
MKHCLALLLCLSMAHAATLVATQPVSAGSLQEKGEFNGTLFFKERSNLASEVSGVVESVYVEEGQKVKKGQKLALLNSDLLNQDILSKEALLKQAQAVLQKSKKDFERFESLYKSNSVSFKEYEDSLFSLKAQEGAAGAIAAELKRLKKERDKKTLIAPYDGMILSRSIQLGEWVNVGDSLFTIANLTSLEINVNVPFAVLRSLKLGQKVETTIAGKPYAASIAALIPVGDAKARTFPIKLAVADSQHHLIEGLEALVKISHTVQNEGLLVPRDAILPSNGKAIVFVARDSKAMRIEVHVSQYSGNLALVRSVEDNALHSGDKVITKGHERLHDGSDIIESSTAAIPKGESS